MKHKYHKRSNKNIAELLSWDFFIKIMHQSSNMIVTIPKYILIGSGQVYVLFIDSQITDVCKHTPATRCPQLRGYCAMSGVKQVALLRAFLLIGVVNAVKT